METNSDDEELEELLKNYEMESKPKKPATRRRSLAPVYRVKIRIPELVEKRRSLRLEEKPVEFTAMDLPEEVYSTTIA